MRQLLVVALMLAASHSYAQVLPEAPKPHLDKTERALLAVDASAAAQTCTPFRYIDHRMIVSVRVNGYGPFDFLLDTGTQMSILDPYAADLSHVAAFGKVNLSGVGMSVKAQWANAELGFSGHNTTIRVVVYDISKHAAHVKGILGMDVLEQYAITIDRNNSCITLSD